jgi:hypothetical protein
MDVFCCWQRGAKSGEPNLPGSPVIAADDPEERATIFLVWVGKWSDGYRLRRLSTELGFDDEHVDEDH